ncbi:MAG: NfeD family protein [Vicinamibacterales bacterium]
MEMLWWHWILLGLVLAGIELLTPGGFFVMFFGVGAIAVGGLALAGAAGPLWMQWLLFSVLSVAALALLRKPLLARFRTGSGADRDSLAGELAVPLGAIPPGGVGRAELRGSSWSARNAGTLELAKGQRCIVVRVEGLMLLIRAEGA